MAHKHRNKWLKVLLALAYILTHIFADFTTECQRPCDCRWQSGNKAAICSNSNLKSIPANLSNDIQILDLSNNNISELRQEVFKKVGLSNLKKLFLRECLLQTIHRSAFATLAIMIELDLSKNKIEHLHPDTFRSTEKLRLINLSNNLIDRFDDGLFRNLKFLQKVEATNNKLVKIGTKTFMNLPQLKILRLDGNNLSHMKPETLMGLNNLSGLDLHNNPWRCDCNLQTFRNWVISHNLYTPPTACHEPEPLKHKLWNELDSTNFACKPTILDPHPDSVVRSHDENVTLTCKVVGNPTPEVTWKFSNKDFGITSFREPRYFLTENTIDLIKWVNLSIVNVQYSDRGNYTCVAENPGGTDEKSITLVLSKYGVGTIAGLEGDVFAILIGCVAAVVIILSTVLSLHFLSKRTNAVKLTKSDVQSYNAELITRSVSEIDKSELTDINPVSKPPRKHEPAPSLASDATEMSELNRTLLDEQSNHATNEANGHLISVIPQAQAEEALLDKLTQYQLNYQPDLLSFSLNRATSSSATPQGRPRTIHSPTISPSYNIADLNPNLSIHPSSSTASTVAHKGAFITLPRRPKPYWSDKSQYFEEEMQNEIPIHILNKCSLMNMNGFNRSVEDCIETPSPAPGTPHASFPRNSKSSPNIYNQLSPMENLLHLKANHNPFLTSKEPNPLKIIISPPETEFRHKDKLKLYNSYSYRLPHPLPRTRRKTEHFLLSQDSVTQV